MDQIRITGLEGCAYLDKVDDWQRKTQSGAITIAAKVDRLYVDTDSDCLIDDSCQKRSIRIAKRGSRSTVVWTPWVGKAAKMGDLAATQAIAPWSAWKA